MNSIQSRSGAARRRLGGGCVAASALAVAIAAAPVRAADTRPGPEGFFQNATMTDAQLSPDGRTLAVTQAASSKDRVRLVVMDVETLKPTVLAQYAASDVTAIHWINDHRLAYGLDDRQVSQGELTADWGLFAINVDGSRYAQLANQRWSAFVHGPVVHEMLPWYSHFLEPAGNGHDPEEVYVGERGRLDDSGARDLKLRLVNTVTHRIKEIDTPIGAEHWVFDTLGEPRVTTTLADDREKVLLRDPASGQWRQLADYNIFTDTDQIEPRFIDDKGRLFVLANRGRDTRSLYTVDLATGKMSDEPFLRSDHYDLEPAFIVRSGKLVGIRYEIDAEVTRWLDPDLAALQAKLDERLPTTINRLSVAKKGDGRFAVVLAYSDRQPGTYYLYDTQHDKLVMLGSRHPEVDPERMSAMESVAYTARDGLRIPAWLTVPQGAPRKNLPLVVLVHGGPYVRGEAWQWNPEVQFLAARGFAVLEPEYRGSTGYGTRLFKAGWKQWGLGMQNDVADGVKWAVDQGLVDPKRVCIAGASYGGYAVLMGLINDPKVYRCGIDWVGVTDIDLMYTSNWSDLSTIWKDYGMPKLVGDRVADAAQLKATSPLLNAHRIHAPLLLAYGGKDKRVPKEHGEKFRDAIMKQPGADVQWVLYDQEGHGWRSVETRIDFWNRASTFLDKNLDNR